MSWAAVVVAAVYHSSTRPQHLTDRALRGFGASPSFLARLLVSEELELLHQDQLLLLRQIDLLSFIVRK
jgi:hypothetical protein